MKKQDRWIMYYDIKRLQEIGLNVSQISRKVKLSRNSVYRYLETLPDELEQLNNQGRRKKLDKHKNTMLFWLQEYPDLSSSQVYDWLKEYRQEYGVCESTAANYVRMLRKKYNIPKRGVGRNFEAIYDPPMGYQMQVDLGQYSFLDDNRKPVKLHFIAFVLSNSRHKYVYWQERHFNTGDLISAHEDAFLYFEGIPLEAVYDQDRLVLVNENYGELLFTQAFASYLKERNFRVHMCRKSDPQSKGRVENVVGYVKKNFARNRIFYNIHKLNEECLAWLERTGNGKAHNATKKIPAEVFLEEKKHLRPITKKININLFKESITALVRKDNTIFYKSNRYSLPLCTYDGTEKYLKLELAGEELVIIDPENETEITRHVVYKGTGKLVKKSSHQRDKNKKIDAYMEEVAALLGDKKEARQFIETIRELRARYIRDQLQLLKEAALNKPEELVSKALNYCLRNSLYSATCFRDALLHFQRTPDKPEDIPIFSLSDEVNANMNIVPETRDLRVYQMIAEGGSENGASNTVKNS